jgi:hypothetical protein
MVNKNKTIINNKNIIQICNLKTKRQRQSKRQNGNNSGSNNPDTNLYTKNNPSYYSPAYTFPNSSALEDEAKRIRFINAMRDPTSTKSPYSLFDSGSNTFPREGNTIGMEQQIKPQIDQNDYFTNPRSLVRPAVRFNTSQFSDSAISPIGRDFYDGYRFEEEIRQQQEQDEQMRQPQEPDQQQQTRFSSPFNLPMSPSFTSPYRGPGAIDHEAIAREEQEAEQARAEQEARQKEEEEFQIVESKRTARMRAEQEAQLEALREDEERQRIEKLKIAQKDARERLGKELERKKEVQRKFKNVIDKLNALISTGENKVQKGSALKTQIKQLLGDPTFTEFTGNRNIGAMADAQKILKFLNEGSETVVAEIKRIEDDKIELEKHLTRQTPAGRGNIHTLEAGGGGKVGGGNPAIR